MALNWIDVTHLSFNTLLPFPDRFLDVVLGGHVFGDHPEAEWTELCRVVKPGGIVILCPGSSQAEAHHAFLTKQGCQWAEFVEPPDMVVRKYWRNIE